MASPADLSLAIETNESAPAHDRSLRAQCGAVQAQILDDRRRLKLKALCAPTGAARGLRLAIAIALYAAVGLVFFVSCLAAATAIARGSLGIALGCSLGVFLPFWLWIDCCCLDRRIAKTGNVVLTPYAVVLALIPGSPCIPDASPRCSLAAQGSWSGA